MGYDTVDKEAFKGTYQVIPLEFFAIAGLADNTSRNHFNHLAVHYTEICNAPLSDGVVKFPLL